LARKSVFNKAKEETLSFLKTLILKTKQKNFINVLKALELENKKSLFVLGD
jgi:large subunit ribosomal protein L4